MDATFDDCKALTSLDISNWNTSAATQMNWMFANCKALTSLDVSNWNIATVTGMDSMFSGCSALTNLDVSNWNTVSVTNMYGVFDDRKALTSLDLGTWNTAAVTDMNQMFSSCGIRQVTFGPDWQFKSGYDSYFPQPNPNDDPAYTIKWQAVGTGSVDYPAGPIYSMYELMDYYNQPRHVSETYVRERSQPTATYYYVDFVDGKSVGVNDDVENLPATIATDTAYDTTVPDQVPTLAGLHLYGIQLKRQHRIAG